MKRKLIEVALPLDAINRAALDEKAVPRRGHPQTIHYWWARRPLAACRAVLFASLVDDPSSHPDRFPTEEAQDDERQRLFRIIEELVKWENSSDETVLKAAHSEIQRSTGGHPPPILDPFCGGGSIPLEAQRLGLETYASDLNPVAVLITKALIEIPPRNVGKPPINPQSRSKLDHNKLWSGAQGLAEDIRYYGKWIQVQAEERLRHLYPRGPDDEPILAYQWARTVKCPNPACAYSIPLATTFTLSIAKNWAAWLKPVLDNKTQSIKFEVVHGVKPTQPGTVTRRGAKCVACGMAATFDFLRSEARANRMGSQLLAVLGHNRQSRIWLPASDEQLTAARSASPRDVPDTELPVQALGFRVQAYGMLRHRDLFSPRQLVAMEIFSDLVKAVQESIKRDASPEMGRDAESYSHDVSVYLGCALSRLATYCNTICHWNLKGGSVSLIFSRQAIPMSWDYMEICPLADFSGNWLGGIEWVADVVDCVSSGSPGHVKQLDATAALNGVQRPLIVTDPPYYDNIGYADLSDFFYIWLRRSIASVDPNLFSTVLVPKQQELVATPYRFSGDKDRAKQFFEDGFKTAFARMKAVQHPDFPLAVFYAFKQAEDDGDDGDQLSIASTGWETILQALHSAGFQIGGTWPIRSEKKGRMLAVGTNALASSVVLTCRPRTEAGFTTRREFVNALRNELPRALRTLRHGNIAPVDLAQAAIGPGMSVFTRHSKIIEADGSPMSVRTALALINQALDEVLVEQEGEFDADTRWALTWFEQHGFNEGPYGDAETLSKAKDTSVNGMKDAGVLAAKAGKVRLLRREELASDWNPANDQRLTVWEITQQLIRNLDTDGEAGAATLLKQLGSLGDIARDLAYRLYNICERQKWAQEAVAYNSLVTAWPEIAKLAAVKAAATATQTTLGY